MTPQTPRPGQPPRLRSGQAAPPPGGTGPAAEVGPPAAGSQTPGARLWGSHAPGAADNERAAAGPVADGKGQADATGPHTSGPAVSSGEGPAGPGTRTWTVVLPPLELLSANHRLHRMQAAELTSDIREFAGWCTRAAKVPHLKRARIVAEVRFWDTRKRDPSNWAPSAKAGADGVVDAGVLDDDDDKHLDGPDMRLGRIDPSLAYVTSVTGKRVRQARMVLHITELPEETS